MSTSMFELTYPLSLWFLLVIPLLFLAMRGSLAELSRTQRAVCLALRAFLLLLLIFALAEVRILRPSNDLAILFAIDQSASLSPQASQQARDFTIASLAAQHSGDMTGVVGFAQKPVLLQPPVQHARIAQSWPEPPLEERKQSDLGAAMEFASAFFPAEKAKRLVLLTDGADTDGQAAQAAQRLAAAGIELFTVPLRNPFTPEVLVEKVEVPRRLKNGEPFDLSASIQSNLETTVKVKVYQNQFLLEEISLALKKGNNLFKKANLKADGKFISYEVEIVPEPGADTLSENNRAQATAALRGEPRVLIVDADESRSRPLAEALRKEKITVETRGPLGAPKTLEDLQPFDLFMLSDLSALTLGRESMELYRRWVQDFGGGFVMLGGDNSFGVGGYFRTPVEQMLPVRMEHDDRQDLPSVALLVVLDRSGSMTAVVQGQTKIALANQGAVFALNVLQPKDYFGVLAVDVRSHVVAPLQQHPAKAPVEQKILSVTAGGGGIYIYTSLAEAFQLLRDAPARIKHLILFSDAADAEEKNAGEMSDGSKGNGTSFDLATAMLAAKITTSVVALGLESDKDTAFLRQLAERGNGRFYLTSDATTLPQIFSTETMKVAQSSLVEEPFQAVPSGKSAIIAGIDWAQSPLLLGYNTTKPKPGSQILLATERGEPLLATWRYGLGQTAAFTSDAKSRWAADWLNWPGFNKFWPQLVRGLMRKSDQASFGVTANESAGKLTVSVDALKPDGAFRNALPLEINAGPQDGATQRLIARQESPGQYSATFDLPSEGTTLFHLTSPDLPDGGYDFAHTQSYPREFLTSETNDSLLSQMAQLAPGKFNPQPAEIFGAPKNPAVSRYDLSSAFLISALLLFPLDIWLRRRTWG
ncbi:MAG: von Willebrand factor type domain protein [Chthoniobacteraceae bacterium]|nr:von Willebrand factor type domain protein [Chthoniobacteraceae bacterium]